jgi:hypothetical protein
MVYAGGGTIRKGALPMPRKRKSVPSGAQLQMLADETAAQADQALPVAPSPPPEAAPLVYAEDSETDRPPFGS